MSVRFEPAGPLRGSLRPPPDKSISHRAALIGAMCDGPTRVTGYLDSADTRSTLDAVRAAGAKLLAGAPTMVATGPLRRVPRLEAVAARLGAPLPA